MVERIDSLTAEQEAMLPIIRDEWIAHGLSTEPANRQLAESGARSAYAAANLEVPSLLIWVDSPFAGVLSQAILRSVSLWTTMKSRFETFLQNNDFQNMKTNVDAFATLVCETNADVTHQDVVTCVYKTFDEHMRNSFSKPVWTKEYFSVFINKDVFESMQNKYKAEVFYQIITQMMLSTTKGEFGSLSDEVSPRALSVTEGALMHQPLIDQMVSFTNEIYQYIIDFELTPTHNTDIRSHMRDWSSGLLEGSWWAGTWSFYDTFIKFDLDCAKPMQGLVDVGKSACWWWPLSEGAVLTERPNIMLRDNQNRLHCETDAAIKWPDGFGVYSWHGTRVPEDLVCGPGWTAERIISESNAEVRRCAIERMGWENFIDQCEATEISRDQDPGNPDSEIILYDLPEDIAFIGDERVRILICTNGTTERGGIRRKFGLTVPYSTKKALEAAAWTYGMTAEEYSQISRRT